MLASRVERSYRESALPTRILSIAPALVFATILSAPRLTFAESRGPDFDSRIAPILRQHCVRCHQGAKAKGKLDLTSAKGLAAGADGARIVVSGKPQESRLLEVVSGDKPEMPKNGKPLSVEEIKVLRDWIAAGAEWPTSVVIKEDPLDWWSLRPVVKPRVPASRDKVALGARTPIDAFISDGLRSAGLNASPEADRRTLIRRLSYDLLGLPPEIDEVEAFVADSDPLAYEKLVDRLLASPHYGERWARHWLDVVHYGETHGYDKDKPRPHAWPYRDYLIRAFNEDRPYAQFVEEQLAGDALEADSRDGIEATGFLAAGPWDFIGHAEVPETKIDGQIARNLDRDDMVTTTLNTFCSLTAQCARCHDHKFDPVTQEHYYSLQAVFAAIDRADRKYDVDPAVARRRHELEARLRHIEPQPTNREGSAPVVPAGIVAERSSLFAALAALPQQNVVYCGTVFQGSGAFRGTGADGGHPRTIHVLDRGDVRRPGKASRPRHAPLYP